jgi:hypothetical protein
MGTGYYSPTIVPSSENTKDGGLLLLSRVPFPASLCAFLFQRGGPIGLPLRVSHRKAKAQVEVEGRKDAELDWSVLNLSLNLILLSI